MDATCGIAGSMSPEQEGIFLAESREEAARFAAWGQVRPVDVWEVDMTGLERPHDEVDGFLLYRGRIACERLQLVDVRIPAEEGSASLAPAEWDKAPDRHESFFQKLSKAERRRRG